MKQRKIDIFFSRPYAQFLAFLLKIFDKEFVILIFDGPVVISAVEMWGLIGSAPDFWARGPGFESSISHNDPDALQDQCVIM